MEVLRILFVCTGNICRSPSAEYLLRANLELRLGEQAQQISIGSAGLGTPGGWELDAEIVKLLRELQIGNLEQFRSRHVNPELLASSDLILTGAEEHRLAIGANFPDAYSRTFTMREAAALLARADARDLPRFDLLQRCRATIVLLQRERGTRGRGDQDIDIEDPHGGSPATYARMFDHVRGVTDVLAFMLAPASLRAPRSGV
jgi:protein-tyrosine phosphatase